MKKEEEYKKHIKEAWDFATNTVDNELGEKNHIASNLKVNLFDKMVSPYHYFIKDNSNGKEPSDEKPTQKQLYLAKKLSIEKPESYTKKSLSDKIDEALAKKKGKK